jgi:hypothetical protein
MYAQAWLAQSDKTENIIGAEKWESFLRIKA